MNPPAIRYPGLYDGQFLDGMVRLWISTAIDAGHIKEQELLKFDTLSEPEQQALIEKYQLVEDVLALLEGRRVSGAGGLPSIDADDAVLRGHFRTYQKDAPPQTIAGAVQWRWRNWYSAVVFDNSDYYRIRDTQRYFFRGDEGFGSRLTNLYQGGRLGHGGETFAARYCYMTMSPELCTPAILRGLHAATVEIDVSNRREAYRVIELLRQPHPMRVVVPSRCNVDVRLVMTSDLMTAIAAQVEAAHLWMHLEGWSTDADMETIETNHRVIRGVRRSRSRVFKTQFVQRPVNQPVLNSEYQRAGDDDDWTPRFPYDVVRKVYAHRP